MIMSREKFAEDLRMMCKKYNVKQKDLAEALQLSCAAVSQFMNGVSLPKPEQLEKMMEKIGATPQETQSMLFRLLLLRTGFSETSAAPEEKEEEQSWPFGMDQFFPPNSLHEPLNLFNDPAARSAVPFLYLEDMDKFTSGTVLNAYARSHSRRFIVRDFGCFDDVAVIETRGEKLNLPHCGLVQLVVAAKLPEKSVSVIAVDGRAASGKTTLARQLALILETTPVHMDDFFLPQELRTPARLAEAGGNVHYERFKIEVLPKLKHNAAFAYQRFDCSKMQPGEMRHISASRWRIVEGAYCLHPTFGDYADLKVFFDIAPETQLRRIRKRNGVRMAENFAKRWIPMEEKYIKTFNIKGKANIILGEIR